MNTVRKKKNQNLTRQVVVLLVEDSLADARYVEALLPESSYKLIHVSSLTEAYARSTFDEFDVVLLDLSLPDGQGLETFLAMIGFKPAVPIVILTGLKDEIIALEAIKLGAQDYVQKNDLNENILIRTIRYSIERHQAEKKIRESAARAAAAEDYLKMALKASKTAIWSWDIIEDIVLVDDECLALFGLAPTVNINKLQDVVKYIHPDDRQGFKDSIESSIRNREDYDVEFRTVWPDGSLHYLNATGKVILDELKIPSKMTGMSRDITRQKVEQENEKKLLILEKHEDFVATLTHDLKTPLIGSDRILDLFLSGHLGSLDEKQSEILSLLRESNAEMLALIQNLLDVYRYDDQRQSLSFSEIDVAALTKICIAQHSTTAENSGINMTYNFPEANHTIQADSVAMRRILMNLLSNALKFTGTNGSVIVSGKPDGELYILEVKDTGVGMPQSDLDSLFQKYSQGNLGKKYQAGTGLGLYLCRQLTEAHGGKIICQSLEGEGTTFIVNLPVRQNG